LTKNGFTPHTRGKIIGSKELLKRALLAERYLELNPSNSSEVNSEARSKSRARSPSRKPEKSNHSESVRNRKELKKGNTSSSRQSPSTNRKSSPPESHSQKNKDKPTLYWRNESSSTSASTSMAKKSDACYRCGGTGHKIAQCPNPDTRGVSAKAMRFESGSDSEEDSGNESFRESPVEAPSDDYSSSDEGSESSGPSNGDRHDSDASSDYTETSPRHDGSDRSDAEMEGEDASSSPSADSEGEESRDSSSEDSERSNDCTEGSYLTFNPGIDLSASDEETIQETLAPMFARTAKDSKNNKPLDPSADMALNSTKERPLLQPWNIQKNFPRTLPPHRPLPAIIQQARSQRWRHLMMLSTRWLLERCE
jgi:hypothetical protein